MEQPEDRDTPRFRVVASADSHFAWMRTRFAVDRTFMAWLRTAASLIGFGFTIVELFTNLNKDGEHAPVPIALGLVLIASGVGALAIALGQYIQTINNLEGPHYQEIADRTQSKRPAVLLGAVMLLLGVAAFISILVRMRLR